MKKNADLRFVFAFTAVHNAIALFSGIIAMYPFHDSQSINSIVFVLVLSGLFVAPLLGSITLAIYRGCQWIARNSWHPERFPLPEITALATIIGCTCFLLRFCQDLNLVTYPQPSPDAVVYFAAIPLSFFASMGWKCFVPARQIP